MQPLVSVIIPTYNCARYIMDCLQSLGAQQYQNFEALIVDDASTDGTEEFLAGRLPDERFRYYRQPRNQGASIARNTGVQMTSGEIIVLLDADDLLLPQYLATVVRLFAEMPDVGLFCCDSRLIGPQGETLRDGKTWHQIQCEIKNVGLRTGPRSLADIFLFSHCFTGFAMRRRTYEAAGGLDQTIFPLDDYDFMLRVAGSGEGVYYLHETLALRRDHDANFSGPNYSLKVGQMKLRALEQALAAYPELQQLGRARSRRLAEVYEELSISYLYHRKWKEGLAALARAGTLDLSRLTHFAGLGWRKARRRAFSPPKPA